MGADQYPSHWKKGSGHRLWGLEPDDLERGMPASSSDVDNVREDVADYLRECHAVDAGVGLLLKELEILGEFDNTLIVVSGNHGIPGFPRARCDLDDIGTEFALRARLPGQIPARTVVDEMTNLMDLGTTFLEAASCAPAPGMTATSLWPRVTGEAAVKDD